MPTNDGGPAFPCGYHRDGNSADQAGMTLRDWYKGRLLPEVYRQAVAEQWWLRGDSWRMDIETECDLMADAMLRERER